MSLASFTRILATTDLSPFDAVKPTACGAVHPIALHDDHTPIACTLPAGHSGDHADDSQLSATACVLAWENTSPTSAWQAWHDLSDRLIVDMAIDAAAARIASTFARPTAN